MRQADLMQREAAVVAQVIKALLVVIQLAQEDKLEEEVAEQVKLVHKQPPLEGMAVMVCLHLLLVQQLLAAVEEVAAIITPQLLVLVERGEAEMRAHLILPVQDLQEQQTQVGVEVLVRARQLFSRRPAALVVQG